MRNDLSMKTMNNPGGIAGLGRGEDTMLAHVAPGEMVVPPVITPETQKIIEHGFHIDNPISKTSKQKTAILYINTNNGYTKFKKLKVNSEENKMIIFNSKEEHTGSSCTDQEFRVVINFNYYDTNS